MEGSIGSLLQVEDTEKSSRALVAGEREMKVFRQAKYQCNRLFKCPGIVLHIPLAQGSGRGLPASVRLNVFAAWG